jgi:hypothetical protein
MVGRSTVSLSFYLNIYLTREPGGSHRVNVKNEMHGSGKIETKETKNVGNEKKN